MRLTSCGFSDAESAKGSELLVQVGPTLVVDIGFDPEHTPEGPHPDLPAKGLQALVDTGATASCIDSKLAMALGLPIVDQAKVSGISGEQTVNLHLAQVHVPSLPHTIYGSFAAVDLVAGGQSHVALIGRTFLRHFRMMYDGRTGEVTIWDDSEVDDQPEML